MNSVISKLMAVSVGHTCNLVNLVMYDFHFDTLSSFDPIIPGELWLPADSVHGKVHAVKRQSF